MKTIDRIIAMEAELKDLKNQVLWYYSRHEIFTHLAKIVSNEFGVSLEKILSSSREHTITNARFVLTYQLHRKIQLSHQKLANLFGRDDHTFSIYNLKKFNDLYQVDPDFREKADKVQSKIDEKQV